MIEEMRTPMTREEYEAKWNEPFDPHRMIHGEPTEQDCDCLSVCLSELSNKRAAESN